jgi:hypothetical protein
MAPRAATAPSGRPHRQPDTKLASVWVLFRIELPRNMPSASAPLAGLWSCGTRRTTPGHRSFAGHTHVPPASSERTHISDGRDLADVRSCRKWLLDVCLCGFEAVAEAGFGDQVPRIGWFGRRRCRQQRSSESWSWLLQQSHLQPGLTDLGARHSGSPTASDEETPGPTGSECVVREAAAE